MKTMVSTFSITQFAWSVVPMKVHTQTRRKKPRKTFSRVFWANAVRPVEETVV